MAEFILGDGCLTRFPPNVERIGVERGATRFWLSMRRNDVELRFPLNESDRRHLAALLLGDLIPGPPPPI